MNSSRFKSSCRVASLACLLPLCAVAVNSGVASVAGARQEAGQGGQAGEQEQSAQDKQTAQSEPLRVYTYPVQALEHAKARAYAQDPALQPALDRLVGEAEAQLGRPFLSVMDKKKLAASGDPHDYFSMGTYWWPNPDTPDGLPYVRRDGQYNPEGRQTDSPNMGSTVRGVFTLALAYYMTGDERYANNAAERMRIWFLDPATRMNPHLEYAQAIPGVTDGRDIGIIDTRIFAELVDAIGMLEGSPALTPELEAGMKAWMAQYLDWLLTSKNGISEGRQHNNHGTFYDVQISSLALFTGRPELARKTTTDALEKRLAKHVAKDGSQPHEMARTLSMTYSAMNAQGLAVLAALAEASGGTDWWQWQSRNGVSLMKAIRFLAPYIDETVAWPKKDIRPDNIDQRATLRELIVRAAAQSGDAELIEQVRQMAGRDVLATERWHFYLPPQAAPLPTAAPAQE